MTYSSLNSTSNSARTEFYSSIASIYDEIFPLSPPQLNFILNRLHSCHYRRGSNSSGGADKQSGKINLLDIGCGTGNLAIALAEELNPLKGDHGDSSRSSSCGCVVTAHEPDAEMLKLARSKTPPELENLCFEQLGMTELNRYQPANKFDAITVVGNTLVHLTELQQISEFLINARRLLKSGGQLIFQIINYDRIYRTGQFFLSTIETDNYRFERRYETPQDVEYLIFHTRLLCKVDGRVIENRIPLYPLKQQQLQQLLTEAGFKEIEFYGDFKGSALTEDSIPLVGIAI